MFIYIIVYKGYRMRCEWLSRGGGKRIPALKPLRGGAEPSALGHTIFCTD